ncbi:protein of unknown function [Cupriavidus taiwanensis]|uniref:Glycosyltransferase subfamily 4-like N-terminal domain-containing protein n=1 Tax=Cupriavidus taiwanensis TaxID=164546 RepID=A0A375I966_9BURK|nr:glycosyltransferase [Cupriavidus taiwanensis]SPK71353.1 protein of unknown function [Cupriavidus taiwanensis]
MKSLLVITELFEIGGLETHLRGEIACLSVSGCKVHLATGSRFDSALLPPEVASVTTDLCLGPDASWTQLAKTVEALRGLIRTQAVECVHAHPFTSLVPGMLAAELEGVPFVLTLHGPASLASCYGPIHEFLLTSVILPGASLVTCVSEEVAAIASPYLPGTPALVLANGVDFRTFSKAGGHHDPHAHWLIISRLDDAKILGIGDFIRKAAHGGLSGVVVVGDGPARTTLEQSVAAEGLTSFVHFLGARTDVAELIAAAGGVAGMGRVVLEGLASRRPVFLVGYDGVKGLLDMELVTVAARSNFSGRNLQTIDEAMFGEQASRAAAVDVEAHQALVGQRYCEQRQWRAFLDVAQTCMPPAPTLLGDLYRMFVTDGLADTGPYLASTELFERLGRLVYGAGRFTAQLAGNYENFRRILMKKSEPSIAHVLADREARVDELNRLLVTRDARVEVLGRELATSEAQTAQLNAVLEQYSGRIGNLEKVAAEREALLTRMDRTVSDGEARIAELQGSLNQRETRIVELNAALSERETMLGEREQALNARDTYISDLSALLEQRGRQVSWSEARLHGILRSNSWKLTRPLRFARRTLSKLQICDEDRKKLYLYGRMVYRRLPLPFKYKYALRSALFRLTGAPSLALAGANDSNAAVPVTQFRLPDAPLPASVRDIPNGTDGVSYGDQTHIKPYFGVRRPHGKRRAAILTNQLLDWHDGRQRFGGGERYALELARLLRELSIEVTFFQPTVRSAESGEYYSFDVKFLALGEAVGEFSHGICTNFTALTSEYDHVYYHLPEYASGLVREDAIMTCHGIWFDHDNYPGAIFRTPPWFEHLYHAFHSPSAVVSVDTNSIGFIRSLWPALAARMRFIPNFFDRADYHPDDARRNKDRLTVLFPRRSQINRGSRIFGDIVSMIPHDVDIVWLGEGDPVDTEIVKSVCRKDSRASFHVADFDQMPSWYQRADIAVIPTIACEGTSLSCIEALACGCAVVSTNVGGLPDLVHDELNGLLVDPDAASIARAINRLIENVQLRERLQRSAAETAANFELNVWRARWVELLHAQGWVNDEIVQNWRTRASVDSGVDVASRAQRWVILTRNAIHGGVESLIREESDRLNAPVIVCGGHDKADTCPFSYTRADNRQTLESSIAGYDVILYHWIPEWALDVVRRSNKKSIEFVHRTDTSDGDKTVPTALVTHSAFLARYVFETYGRFCRVVDHPIAVQRFVPQERLGSCVGAITSYYETKGIDIFLRAWALLKSEFPDTPVRFYGEGDDLPRFKKLAAELGVEASFLPATRDPWEAMKEFRCFVVPSRIEGLPVAVLEALAADIPVVASGLPGMVEFNELSVKRGYERYLALARPEDPEDLANVLRDLLVRERRPGSHDYIREYYQAGKHCSDLVDLGRILRR